MSVNQADPYGRGSYCIVVAMHGDNSREAEILRKFRDSFLSRLPGGDRFIEAYYRASPKIVPILRGNRVLASATSILLSSFSRMLSVAGL